MHNVAICISGMLWSFGGNAYGQLGTGNAVNVTDPTAPIVGGLFVRVAGGMRHSAAICTEGHIWTWGDGTQGQFGIGAGEIIRRFSPTPLYASDALSISVGEVSSMIIDSDGQLTVWSLDYDDLVIDDGIEFVRISTGVSHSLAIDSDGNVWQFDRNGFEQVVL